MKRKSLLQLKKEIKTAAQDYYEGHPKISDGEFDILVDELSKSNPNDELLNKVGWGYDIHQINGEKINHLYGLVGSLSKVHSVNEISPSFRSKITVLSSKLDGASCVAYYNNGKFTHAVTRGDGTKGIIKDLQFNKIIEKYNLNIPKDFTGGIRGEIVMSNYNWVEYKLSNPDAKFPRNVATGLFMRDDVSDDLKYVDFVTYKIIGSENHKFTTYVEILETLEQWGFNIVDYYISYDNNSLDDELITKVFSLWHKYPMDGVVIQTDIKQNDSNIKYNDIAYKFQAEIKETTVTGVEWNLSKNNVMVPLIHVEPIELSGAIVSKTSGFNYEYIVNNNIGVGTIIKLCRSGEVIPHIVEIVKSTTAELPAKCPVCGQLLSVNGVELVCENEHCANIEKSRIFMWIETLGVRDILGVGDALLENLYAILQKYFNRANISVEDLYANNGPLYNSLVADTIIGQFTPSAAEKVRLIFNNLVKPANVDEVIYACNIRGLGKTICEKISHNLQDWFDTGNIDYINQISDISGLGNAVKNAVLSSLNIFSRLFSLVELQSVEKHGISTPTTKIMITGALSVPRKQFEDACRVKNIYVTTSIKDCNYLITNDTASNSSKMQKALKNGITIISENDFRNLFKL